MKQTELTDAFRKAASTAGYAFHTGPLHRMNGEARVYPAAWMEPAALSSCEGRREGEVKYRVEMHLAALPACADETPTLWARLEADAMDVVKAVQADGRVCEVSRIGCTPAAQSLTAHGEVSVKLACDVTMYYYF